MKHPFLFFIFLISINFYSQNYNLPKPKELKYLDLFIEQPKELPFFEIPDNFNPKNLKIKSIISPDETIEYDFNGNILSEQKKDNFYTTERSYIYNNNTLVEKKTFINANKEKIDKKIKEDAAELRRQVDRNGRGSVATVGINDNYNKVIINKVTLDKRNRLISYSYQEFKIENSVKELLSDDAYNISYEKGKVSEIKSKSDIEKYYYKGNFIIKKEYYHLATNSYSQEIKIIFSFNYDKNKNLTAIWYDNTRSTKGKIDSHDKYLVDSANYDNQNRIIWKGTNRSFITYKYDIKNNITESIYTNSNKLDTKREYEYNNENKIAKITEIKYRYKKNDIIPTFIKTFLYQDNLLKVIQESSPNYPGSKTTFEYNDKAEIIRSSKYEPKRLSDHNTANNEYQLNSETKYTWEGKMLTIERKYQQPVKYTFY